MNEASRRGPHVWLICAVFFASGAPALVYQLVWQRALFTIYGINVESVTVVVTAFMLGLGLGSVVGGWLSVRRGVPLLVVFGVIELVVGAYGWGSLELFGWVGARTLAWPPWAVGLVTFGLVLLPTLGMGATLPVLVAHLVRRSSNVGRSVGLLYFVNTLGSAVACFVCALVLFRTLGMRGSVWVACGLNVSVGVGALVLGVRGGRAPEPEVSEEVSGGEERFGGGAALGLAGLAGAIALSYEIVWFRVYAFVSAGRAWAFALVLGSFLVGIAGGSLWSRWCCREGAGSGRALGGLVGCALGASALGFVLVPGVSWLVAWGVPYWATLPWVALNAGLLGAIFPLVSHLSVRPDGRAGARLSYLYLANIVGSALGSWCTGFVLLDLWGVRGLSVGLSLAGVVLAVAALSAGRVRGEGWAWGAGLGSLVGVLVLVGAPSWYGGVFERLQYKGSYEPEDAFLATVENRHGVITVDRWLNVFGGGIYDGQFNVSLADDANMIVRPYALSLLHPAPRRVLMIGLASGSWAQVVAQHPQVESLTVVEINPGYLELIRERPAVASLLENPRVEVVIDDGRRWLQRHAEERFDAVVLNMTYHWRANASNLLSREFLGLVRERLAPGGVYLFNTTSSERVQRTACEEFPHAVRLVNCMVVSEEPFDLDAGRWACALWRYRLDGEPLLRPWRVRDLKALLKTLRIPLTRSWEEPPYYGLEERASILKRTEGVKPVTDDNMGTEWE